MVTGTHSARGCHFPCKRNSARSALGTPVFSPIWALTPPEVMEAQSFPKPLVCFLSRVHVCRALLCLSPETGFGLVTDSQAAQACVRSGQCGRAIPGPFLPRRRYLAGPERLSRPMHAESGDRQGPAQVRAPRADTRRQLCRTHVYASKSPLLMASISCSVTLMISCFRAEGKDTEAGERTGRSHTDARPTGVPLPAPGDSH